MDQTIWPGGNLKLRCTAPSNLAKTTWERDGSPLTPEARLQFLRDGLLILNASDSDAGRYRCLSTESSKTEEFSAAVAEYQVSVGPTDRNGGTVLIPRPQVGGASVAGLQAVVALLVIALLALLVWNFYKGHLPLPWNCGKKNRQQTQVSHEHGGLNQNAPRPALVEDKPLMVGTDNGRSNNNHTGEAAFGAAEEHEDPAVNLPTLKYIDDESEI